MEPGSGASALARSSQHTANCTELSTDAHGATSPAWSRGAAPEAANARDAHAWPGSALPRAPASLSVGAEDPSLSLPAAASSKRPRDADDADCDVSVAQSEDAAPPRAAGAERLFPSDVQLAEAGSAPQQQQPSEELDGRASPPLKRPRSGLAPVLTPPSPPGTQPPLAGGQASEAPSSEGCQPPPAPEAPSRGARRASSPQRGASSFLTCSGGSGEESPDLRRFGADNDDTDDLSAEAPEDRRRRSSDNGGAAAAEAAASPFGGKHALDAADGTAAVAAAAAPAAFGAPQPPPHAESFAPAGPGGACSPGPGAAAFAASDDGAAAAAAAFHDPWVLRCFVPPPPAPHPWAPGVGGTFPKKMRSKEPRRPPEMIRIPQPLIDYGYAPGRESHRSGGGGGGGGGASTHSTAALFALPSTRRIRTQMLTLCFPNLFWPLSQASPPAAPSPCGSSCAPAPSSAEASSTEAATAPCC